MPQDMDYILNAVAEYYKKYENIRNEYCLGNRLKFNFFSAISDFYYRENFHSDILKLILDPYTEEVGNYQFLKYFLDMIGCDSNDFKSDVTCVREEKRIDILIKSNSKAIIIENKINGAVDQPNQLARYMEALKAESIDVVKIVYLTLTEAKKIDFSTYDDEHKEYIKTIKSKLHYLSVISNTKHEQSLLYFFDKCITITEKQEKNQKNFSVFLTHYKKLLMHLGGEIMVENAQKKLIKTIYSEKRFIRAKDELMSLLQNQWHVDRLFGELVAEIIQEKDNKYESYDYPTAKTIVKTVCKDFGIVFYTPLAYGFISLTSDGRFSVLRKCELFKILEEACFDSYSDKAAFADEFPQWIYRDFDFSSMSDATVDEATAIISKQLKLLEEKCQQFIDESEN